MRKYLALILCLVVVFAVACPVSVFAEEKTQLTFMCFDENRGSVITENVKRLVEEFNATNPYNVEIVPEYIASEQTKTKLPTLMAANEAPDIFNCWAAGYLQPYVEAGKVYNLNDAFAADPEWKNSFKDSAFESLTYADGGIYGVPTKMEMWGFFFNTTIYERCGVELPNTWQELVDGLKVIMEKEPDTIPMAFGNKDAWPVASLCEALCNRVGGQEKFEQAAAGELPWSDESFVNAAALIKGLLDEGILNEGINGFPVSEGLAQFKAGKAACVSYLSTQNDVISTEPDGVKVDEVVFRNVPAVDGGAGDPGWWLGQVGYSYAISETCPNKEAAVAFIKLVTGKDVQEGVMQSAGVPVYRSDLLDMSKASPLMVKLMADMDQMTGMFVFYDVVLGSVLGNEFNGAIQSVVAGEEPQAALEAFNQFYIENSDF